MGEAGQWLFLWCPLRRVPHPLMRLPSYSTTLPPPSYALTHPLSACPPTHLIIRPSTSHPPAHLFMFPAHLTVQPLTSSSTRPPLHLLIGAPFCTRCASSLFLTHLPAHSSLCPFTGPRATLRVSFLACPSSTTGRAPACGNHAGCSVAPGVGSSCCPWSVGGGRGVRGWGCNDPTHAPTYHPIRPPTPPPSHPPTRLPPQSLVVALTSTRCALSRSVSGVIDTEGTLVWRRPWLTRGTARALAPLPLACVGGVRGGGRTGRQRLFPPLRWAAARFMSPTDVRGCVEGGLAGRVGARGGNRGGC